MRETTDVPVLSARFEDALAFAARLHRSQVRKGTEVPYLSHLLAVAALVLERGGGEDAAIAALLHDAAEDQGGRQTLAEIRARFGDAVAGLVAECSDTFESPKPPWRERKERDIATVAKKSASARLISAAAKLHNAGATLKDFRAQGDPVWRRFKGGREGTLWYLKNYALALCSHGPNDLGSDLLRVVSELERAAGLKAPRPPRGARDFSALSFKRTYSCPCGHRWSREREHLWWDTERGPSDAEIAAAKRVGTDCPRCATPLPPPACPECGGAVSVEARDLRRSALDDYAYEEEDFWACCADGHAVLFAHRFDSKK
jgi:hypothetical protein